MRAWCKEKRGGPGIDSPALSHSSFKFQLVFNEDSLPTVSYFAENCGGVMLARLRKIHTLIFFPSKVLSYGRCLPRSSCFPARIGTLLHYRRSRQCPGWDCSSFRCLVLRLFSSCWQWLCGLGSGQGALGYRAGIPQLRYRR